MGWGSRGRLERSRRGEGGRGWKGNKGREGKSKQSLVNFPEGRVKKSVAGTGLGEGPIKRRLCPPIKRRTAPHLQWWKHSGIKESANECRSLGRQGAGNF